jgi:hypothetical protein
MFSCGIAKLCKSSGRGTQTGVWTLHVLYMGRIRADLIWFGAALILSYESADIGIPG